MPIDHDLYDVVDWKAIALRNMRFAADRQLIGYRELDRRLNASVKFTQKLLAGKNSMNFSYLCIYAYELGVLPGDLLEPDLETFANLLQSRLLDTPEPIDDFQRRFLQDPNKPQE